MVFVKVTKNKAYFKRYQTKYRRRREGKTDFYARKKLINQDQYKYQSPKFRLVVRFSNTKVVCQVVKSHLHGDATIAAATSQDLVRHYGLCPAGAKNYAAAYATGLLVARRALTAVGLADEYAGVSEVTGEIYEEPGEKCNHFVKVAGRRPLRVLLDVGIRATTTGSRVFGALKGAVDGGLDIPHNGKRFPGYDAEEGKANPEVMRDYIFGDNTAEAMRWFQDPDGDQFDEHEREKKIAQHKAQYETKFARYLKAGLGPDDLEDHYKAVHDAIRANPVQPKGSGKRDEAANKRFKRRTKKTRKDRQGRVMQKRASRVAKLAAAAGL